MIKNFQKFKLYENIEMFETVSLDGEFFHGTSYEDELFIPEIGYSDYDAIWVTDGLYAAREFADYHYGGSDFKKVVLKTHFKSNNIISIPAQGEYTYKDLMEFYGVSDLRETIPFLSQKYNGWITKGSIDKFLYNDIAIFDDDLLNFTEVSYYIDDQWTQFKKIK
jgi:hypothetical protein